MRGDSTSTTLWIDWRATEPARALAKKHIMPEKPRKLSPERKAQMREYSNNRYKRLKANGQITLQGRYQGKNGIARDIFIRDYNIQRKLEASKCVECQMPCEEWNHVMFAWDHIDRTTKLFTISQARKHVTADNAHELLKAEIDKCQLMCHNCHAYKTWAERDHDPVDRIIPTVWGLFD